MAVPTPSSKPTIAKPAKPSDTITTAIAGAAALRSDTSYATAQTGP
jgi:hypothetical protein